MSLEDFQQQQHFKWIAHITTTENKDLIKMLSFHTILNKRLGRKLPSISEIMLTVDFAILSVHAECFQ